MVCAFTSPVNHHSGAFEKVCCHLGSSTLGTPSSIMSSIMDFHLHPFAIPSLNFTQPFASTFQFIVKWLMHRPKCPSHRRRHDCTSRSARSCCSFPSKPQKTGSCTKKADGKGPQGEALLQNIHLGGLS